MNKKRLQKLAGIIKEIQIIPNDEVPEEWTEEEPSEYERSIGKVRIFTAPTEGWDDAHNDSVYIVLREDGKYYIDENLSFSEYLEGDIPYDDEETALKFAILVMKEIMEDWG